MLHLRQLFIFRTAEDVLAPVEQQLEGHPAGDPDEEVGHDCRHVVEQTLLSKLGLKGFLPDLDEIEQSILDTNAGKQQP